MYKAFRHIFILLFSILVVFSSCANDDEKNVISRSKLAEIYAEMLVTDQWITSTPGMRMIADTSLVYEPILQKYGYNLDDYLASVDRYMDDPERFSRILRKSGEIIGKSIKDAEDRLAEYKRLEALPKIISDLRIEEFFPYIYEEPYIHYYDSLTFEPDSLSIYRLIQVEMSDTLYDGLRMILKTDTFSISDSAAVSANEWQQVLDSALPNKLLNDIKDTPRKRID